VARATRTVVLTPALYTVRVVDGSTSRIVQRGVVRRGGHVTALAVGLDDPTSPWVGVGCTGRPPGERRVGAPTGSRVGRKQRWGVLSPF
jgi:hypothetical protein